ncbi:hypothetical protein LG047_08640 [Methylocystis sp. WRRC1]|uniref:hypothetical protein n=1 Tax=Methylocystis sp. WRRC1 TaxID=1732014 RepID=UPI001D1343D1|nr:hypothetical protein [Methylocystis sp. WRRC1]MCC3245390.1 hypothetical protein [Methylocystis sp. WRRC1]
MEDRLFELSIGGTPAEVASRQETASHAGGYGVGDCLFPCRSTPPIFKLPLFPGGIMSENRPLPGMDTGVARRKAVGAVNDARLFA